jgi:hypothetical protein
MLLRLECAHGGDLTDPVPLRLSLHHSSRFLGAPVLGRRGPRRKGLYVDDATSPA